MFKILDRAKKLEKEGVHVYHLELGNPRLRPPMEIIEATMKALRDLDLGYTSSFGLEELRSALAFRFSSITGRHHRAENVLVSPANLLISQFLDVTCNPGDRVVVFSPAFPTYFAAMIHNGLEIIDIPLHPSNNYKLTEEAIEKAMLASPTAIIVNSANNPTGAVYSKKVLEFLAAKSLEKGIWLLSDETYSDVCFGAKFFSMASIEYHKIVVISSFSKVFSIPGFRTGYAIADKEIIEKLALSSSTLISCMPAFTQLGCLAGLRVIDSYVKEVKKHFSRVIGECSSIINNSGGLHCSNPQAGFYIFLDIGKTGLDDATFSNRLLEDRHTAVTPGRSFGKSYKDCIRIAACGNYDDVVQGVRQVADFSNELM